MNKTQKVIGLSISLIAASFLIGWAAAPNILDTVIENTFETWRGQSDVGEYNYLIEGEYLTKKDGVIYINSSYGLVTVFTNLNQSRGYRECAHGPGDKVRFAVLSNVVYHGPIEHYLKRDFSC